VVVATGNGTAGVFAPAVLRALGCEVVPLHTELDHAFPHYEPNPEDLAMLHDLAAAVTDAGADLGFAFDGDGDRCGVVDGLGREIFSDKIGVLIARDIAARHDGARFVVDVKSTGLFATDPELARLGAATDYWKTGHSHIKRRLAELGALAGFEKSGHFFFNPPLGRGYDDGLVAAIAVCDLIDRNPGRSLADLYDGLPRTWSSPTLSAACPDEVKYDVAERVRGRIEQIAAAGGTIAGRPIADLVTVNGIRVVADDGTWGLVRASSNKPELVVVVESPVSEARMRARFSDIDAILRENTEVGAYSQAV
jgi:phosphomannomutase/phosphoglucomutase